MDLGEVFLRALEDPDTVEIMLNADGALWQERLGEQIRPIGAMSGSSAEAAMRTIAAYHHATITRDNPSIECELPLDGSRFAGQIPPIVSAPVFAVRKRASRVFTLDQYVAAGIMTAEQKRTLVVAIRDHRNLLVTGSTGSGKAQPVDAKVLTPTGWRCMGDLAVGDPVTCPDGTVAPILGVYPQGSKRIFRITFYDGRSAECCGDHLWKLWHHDRGWVVLPLCEVAALHARPSQVSDRLAVPLAEPFALENPEQCLPIPPYTLGFLLGDGSFRTGYLSFTTPDPEHMLARLAEDMPDYEAIPTGEGSITYRLRMKDARATRRYFGKSSSLASVLCHNGETKSARKWSARLGIPETTIAERIRKAWTAEEVLGFADRKNPCLGRSRLFWTVECDGIRRSVSEWSEFTGVKPDIIRYRLIMGWPGHEAVGLVQRTRVGCAASSLKLAIASLGLAKKSSHEKFIPEAYKRGSVAQRVALLQGLLDTDGSVGSGGTHASFTSTSERLARDVQEIAWSIGAIATIAPRQTYFTDKHGEKQAGHPSWRVSIVHPEIARLFSLPRQVALCRPSSVVNRRLRISRIEEIGEKPAQCIKIDHPEGLYLTNDYVVTHNTTLLNALIRELTDQFPNERLIVIEDTAEIQCAAKDYVQYHTSPERTMTHLVRMALRMRPDRILVGEVRGPEALDLLMAWNTGHEGGIATVHANNAAAGLTRLSTLVSMHPDAPREIEPLIGEAVDLVVHIERHPDKGRVVREIMEVIEFNRSKQVHVTEALC